MAPGSVDIISPVIEVDEASFEREVIDRSYLLPVLVDFWAPWCGPCRVLGPLLERLAHAANGAWVLAKLDTQQNQNLALQYRITGIPAVKAFVDGRVVDEFMGALPEAQVRAFIEAILPSEADRQAEAAMAYEAAGDLPGAEAAYRAALAADAMHAAALLGLGRVLFNTERYEEAAQQFDQVPYPSPERSAAESWAAKARFKASSAVTGDETDTRRRVAENPDDMDARLALATLLAARGEYRDALEGLLVVLQRNRDAQHDRAHEKMLEIFRALGDEDPLTQEYRPRLAALLW